MPRVKGRRTGERKRFENATEAMEKLVMNRLYELSDLLSTDIEKCTDRDLQHVYTSSGEDFTPGDDGRPRAGQHTFAEDQAIQVGG